MPPPSLTEIGEALDQSIQHTLEIMCFAEAAPAPAGHAEPSMRARVAFRSSLAGFLELAITPTAARTLAAALLGLPAGEPPCKDDVDGTICELSTVICGRFLSLFDPSSSLQLESPRLGVHASTAPGLRLSFKLDDGDLIASVHLD